MRLNYETPTLSVCLWATDVLSSSISVPEDVAGDIDWND